MQTNIPILVSGEIYISLQAKRDLKKRVIKIGVFIQMLCGDTHLKNIF